MYQAESCAIFLDVSAVHFGDALGRKWWLGTRMKPNRILSALASKNKTHLDTSLFTSSWHPQVFGELEISSQRERLSAKIGSESTSLVFQNCPGFCAPDPQAGGGWRLGMSSGPVTRCQWLKRGKYSCHLPPPSTSCVRCPEGHAPLLCGHLVTWVVPSGLF